MTADEPEIAGLARLESVSPCQERRARDRLEGEAGLQSPGLTRRHGQFPERT